MAVHLETDVQEENQHLEKQKLLVPFNEEAVTEDMYFDNCDVPFHYEQDKRIDRSIRHYGSVSSLAIDIHRVLFTHQTPVFSSIINTVVFSNSEDLSLSSELKLTKKMQNSILNIEKTQFLVDQVQLSPEEVRYVLFLCLFNTNRDLNRIGNNFVNEMRNFLPDLLNMSPAAYVKETFAIPQDSLDICADLLKSDNPVSILFYGKPGSGKTELAKTICKESGKKVYIFKNESETEGRNFLDKLECLLSMERKDSVIYNIIKGLHEHRNHHRKRHRN